MSAKTYSQEQILSGIRIFWREELNCKSPIDPDRSFIEQLKAEDNFDDLFRIVPPGLERLFGFACAVKQWEDILGIRLEWRTHLGIYFLENSSTWEKKNAPRLTFRALAEFIREQLNPIMLEPVTLLGKPCLTAGIFRGLEQLAAQVKPKVKPFGPSTPIRRCLRGVRLRRFWSRLRWMIEDQIPPPPKLTLSTRDCMTSLVIKFGIGPLIALWRGDLEGLLLGVGWTFMLLFPMVWIAGFIENRLNPLPDGIETFGDLAQVLAAIILDQQSECASCSTP